MYQPFILFIILIITIALFVWGYWRYDFVALFALALSVLTGIVPAKQAFSGFSNPAVITVACVMILTYAITQSGVLNVLLTKLEFLFKKPLLHISLFTTTIAIMSAFMNNVGALGLMMPIAIQSFIKQQKSPSIILMPIAFSSVLGGLITVIGTPPNLLISSYREEIIGSPYNMFDFMPVGLTIAFFGILFISLIGWKLVPSRQKNNKTDDLFQMSDYMTEIKVVKDSPFCDKTIKEFLAGIKADFDLIAMIHRGKKKFAFSKNDIIRKNDILIIEASPENLEKILESSKLILAGDKPFSSKKLSDSDIIIMEAVVPPGSNMEGRSAAMTNFHYRHSINLLALSRKGISFKQKLNDIRFAAGDIILLQGNAETLRETIVDLGLLPLAERDVKIGLSQKNFLPLLFFVAAIILAALKVLPITISFLCAVLAVVIFKATPLHNLYRSLDSSVLLLLAAIIPIGGAIETTGTADLISNAFIQIAGQYSPVVALIAVLIVTMTLSDLMNNAATAIVMAPIALNIARSAHVNIDTFLMAVAIGASCSFLTPIAHQNNTMVMGPGAYHFFDYARLGLILEIIIIVTGVPALLWFWPLH
ncbi:SLC13 family permease [Legionella parisiensis]|uniref:RCK C-terminal domain-containing protein n=1 Tax=Legionella parisiensis TaxID=45071 RepID=A0A1E5JTU7_9GAMM|nr:SLC13 family permease [Legionella parisiensis]KTD40777.1 putative transporter [Legionella parisiensis]OEH47946.1 hypothetical protein lpari_01134 [Legionella parisiensis]STX76774.1 putative transporter [Legionella parisiensis]